MDTYLTISEAVNMLQVSAEVLNKLVQSGRIRTVTTSAGYLVNQSDVTVTLPLTERPEYKEFMHLAGIAISMSEAARRYDVTHSNISRWARDGMIERLGINGRQVLVDEAQVATAAKIFHTNAGRQGVWIFRGGLPYAKKSGQ